LERTTAELTRSFHKLYELEQELTFYKIDAKLSPLHTCSLQNLDTVDSVDSVAESPYIGKARHIRNTITSSPPPRCSSSSSSSSSTLQEDSDVHSGLEES
ncbi:centriolin-like, partial [Scomber scombrus]